eukprot:NODE_8_length_66115_cov_0.981823.p33 type:complete len:229 gc:universal NODE_8_length_66115_cov_0.981823:60003-59317(-)
MFLRKFNLLRGHRSRSRLLKKLDKPNATIEDAYLMVKAFATDTEVVNVTFMYNTKMFKRIKLTSTLPLEYFKAKKSVVAVYGPLDVINKTDAEIKISDLDDVSKHEFTNLICYESNFKELTKLGKYLGTKNLMPSTKKGTVTRDLQAAIDISRKSSKMIDNNGIVDVVLGDTNLDFQKIKSNLSSLFKYVNELSGTTLENNFIKQIFIKSTQSPAVPLNRNEIKKLLS